MEASIRMNILIREPFAGGLSFGEVGPYERLVGRVEVAVDPAAPAYRSIVDLEHAPRSSSGLVEYSFEFYLLKPVDLDRGNHRLVYDVNNRGNKRILQFFNDGVHSNGPFAREHAGNGFLMRRGYTVVWSGWQGDILLVDGRLTMDVPAATESGQEITGVMRAEFIGDHEGIFAYPLSGNDYTSSYEAVSGDTASATFTLREYERDRRIPIPAGEWEFATLDQEGRPVPSTDTCYLPAGFKPGWIYELIYTAKNPTILGLGFTGVRDFISFLHHADVDGEGTRNPLKHDGAGIEKAYAWGRSQSGRFLREFVYRGFNEDTQGRRVFDAISPHISGAGRVFLNYRFAQPGRYPRKHGDHLYPSDQFPFAYPVTTDPLTGKTDGILKRPETDPLVLHTQTSSEYWERRGSLVHTDSLGNDLADHEIARNYLFSSSQHHADPLLGPLQGAHLHLSNPLNTTPLLRAMLDALDEWATEGTPPPESRVPTRTGESAVPADVVSGQFPVIPGLVCPSEPSRLYVQDYGPDFERGIISEEPPGEEHSLEYTVLVPQVDAVGNELPGIRTPHVEVPLATFTGWNLRPKGSAEMATAGILGSYLPLATTANERRAGGDSRPSVEERYGSRAHYVRAIESAARRLVEQRLLLEEDVERYVELAKKAEAFNKLGGVEARPDQAAS